MKRAVVQIAACALVLILFCFLCRIVFFRTYTVRIPTGFPRTDVHPEGLRLLPEEEGIIRSGEVTLKDGFFEAPIQPLGPGDVWVSVVDEEGSELTLSHLRVGRFNTVYNLIDGSFTGDQAVCIAVTVFWLLISVIMIWNCFQMKGAAFYSYTSIYCSGFSLFSLVNFFLMLRVAVSHLVSPNSYSMLEAYSTIYGAGKRFMILTSPLILLFAAAMIVSNIALLRHEKPRIQNALGILTAVLLIAGEAVGMIMFFGDFSGPEWKARAGETAENVYATAFVYFECMLAGSVICGIRAARYEPEPDKDFIVILGCWFRKDGSLPPLLRGRVDRAVSFWKMQRARTGREAVFIPSGGQGRNESMAEAEAMRRYLLSQNIPERLILPEDQAANTWQNMAFSKRIIDSVKPGGSAVFSTTNYHVFRSGVWARNAGFPIEGIGSGTKWWFWPNAFMREVVGLMERRWKQEVLFLLLLTAFFAALSLALY